MNEINKPESLTCKFFNDKIFVSAVYFNIIICK